MEDMMKNTDVQGILEKAKYSPQIKIDRDMQSHVPVTFS